MSHDKGPSNREEIMERSPQERPSRYSSAQASLPPSAVPLPPSSSDRRVERLLAINLAALGSLGAVLLGMGQRSAGLAVAVLVAAVVSVWVTDIQGWFRLPRRAVNVLASLAALVFFWDFLRTRGALGALLGIADLLCYLQIILLFQKKDIRSSWSLITLSVFEVLVAAAFSQGFFFGAMLAVYLFLGLVTLSLLFLYHQCGGDEMGAPVVAAGEVPKGRWPLAHRQPSFERSVSGSVQAAAGWELLMRLSTLTVASLLLALGIFLVFPRLTAGAWRGRGGDVRATVGFRDKVTLGELGRIIQDPQEVLRLTLLDDATGAPHAVMPDVYLRGAVLTRYLRGQWEPNEPRSWGQQYAYLAPSGAERPANLVRQQITIEPLDRDELFCVWPFASYQEQPDLLFDEQRQRLLRDASRLDDRFSFQLWTTAFRDDGQSEISPVGFYVPKKPLLQMPPRGGPDSLPGLAALADRWVRESRLGDGNRYGIARLLERKLRDSGQFQYSLEGPARDLSIDPIEDFVTQHPQGHCEYFATALALMLRSQGIPARVVMGYRTDEYDRVGHYYQVRQLHAHSWVEAYLEREQVPSSWIGAGQEELWRRGGWLRLDATPAAALAANGPRFNPLEKAVSWLERIWTRYVVDMDRPRQREAIYQPLIDWVKATIQHLADPGWWRELLLGLVQFLDPRQGNWFSWRGGLAAVLVALAAFLLRKPIRSAWRWWRQRRRRVGSIERQRRARVAFYRRLEALLARRGLTRAAWQTQREFAREAGPKLATALGRPQLSDLPAHVVEAFYQVRFGQRLLDEHQTLAVEQAIAELERACREK